MEVLQVADTRLLIQKKTLSTKSNLSQPCDKRSETTKPCNNWTDRRKMGQERTIGKKTLDNQVKWLHTG